LFHVRGSSLEKISLLTVAGFLFYFFLLTIVCFIALHNAEAVSARSAASNNTGHDHVRRLSIFIAFRSFQILRLWCHNVTLQNVN
jgi:hypothetical protein